MPPKTTTPAAKPPAQGDRTDVKYRTQLDPLEGISASLFEVLNIVKDPSSPMPEFDEYLTTNGEFCWAC